MLHDKRLGYLYAHGPPHRARERRVIRTGVPGFRLRFYPGVREDARAELKAFARWLRGELRFRHPVWVTVVPHATVMGHEGVAGWAVFLIPSADYVPGDVVRIFLGAGAARVMETVYGYGRGAALEKLLHDLAHEVVHYEQWRDGRPVTERGVNRRAAALVRRYLASRPAEERLPAAAA
ncbi:MAG TPA: hypothetical protein VF192_04415 [Longimicrobiales bacterium]